MKHLPFFFLAWFALSTAGAAPNIITVFIDDMGYSDLSTFGGDVETEHIDQLASEGIKFTQFYVNSPICSPSRTALTTGQYPQRWRITSYLNNRKNNRERGMAQWLDPAAPVLARELQKRGYATGHFGKWHMGGQRDVSDAPPISDYGFDESLTNFEGMGAKLLPLTMTPTSDEPGRIWEKAVNLGEPVTWMQRSEITGGFVDAALDFIDKAQEQEKPFFVNVWPDDVHTPLYPPLDKWGDDMRALYNGVLDAMDEQLAPLFARIREDEQLSENTLIVVCSDNGHHPGAGTSDPFRGAKTWLYEGGIRSPLIVWGPGFLQSEATGTVNEASIFSAIDLNRSLYALTDTPLPEGAELDGENVLDTLVGKLPDGREAPIFFRRPPDRPGFMPRYGPDEDNPDLAVRDGKWKFLINYDHSSPQLFDLDADISESNNIASEYPEVAKRLEKAVFEWNATMPADAGDPTFTEEKPNIVIVLADDCTFTDMAVYGGQANTPNIDGLATEGMKFERCFQAAPMCSPTRHNLYTGIYPVKSGAYPNHTFVKPEVESIVHYLKPLDYRVALTGKTHIAPKEAFPFEYSKGEGGKGPSFDALEKLIFESKANGTPFCQIVCSNEPHEPYTKGDPSQYPLDEIVLPPYLVDTPETREHFQKYLAEITFFDGEVGQVLDLLKKHDVEDNTIVIMLSEQGNAFPFAKWTLYDPGIRSGMIIRWPGHVEPESTSDALVEYVDVLPTLLEASGGEIPEVLEGRSFLPVLHGETDEHKDHVFALMTTRGINDGAPFYGIRSVRGDRYKLIWNLTPEARFENVIMKSDYFKSWVRRSENGRKKAAAILDRFHYRPEYELFDILEDPLETTNLANNPAHAETLADLKQRLEAWMKNQGDLGQATEMAALDRMKRGKPKKKKNAVGKQ